MSLQWETHNPSGRFRVVVTKPIPGDKWLKILLKNDCRVEVCQSDLVLTNEQLKAAIGKHCDAMLGQLTENWNEDMLLFLKRHGGKLYSQMAVGYNNVDAEAAARMGLPVGNTPGVLTETTAEMAVALTFTAGRRMVEADNFMRGGKYKGWLPHLFLGKRMWRETVGIIGAGRIGSTYARMMCEGFKMNVVYFDLYQAKPLEKWVKNFGHYLEMQGEEPVTIRRCKSIEEVCRLADVTSLHVVLNKHTRHLVNAERLALMKPNAVLINASRGPVVDEKALVAHLQSHPNFRAGLDVYEKEPTMMPGLKDCQNAVIVPHIASASSWTREGMSTVAACNIVGILNKYPVWKQPNYQIPFVDGAIDKLPKETPSIPNWKMITRSKL